ncbi:MAG: DNA recombination protein RmuC [Halobacteriovoraceae bacterium]|nr:DNA recombination protein RmuC [Halobacteriovoraceae bacterium]
MDWIFISAFSLLFLLSLLNLFLTLRYRTGQGLLNHLQQWQGELGKTQVDSQQRTENLMAREFATSRSEMQENAKGIREEVSKTLSALGESNLARMNELAQHQKNLLDAFGKQISELTQSNSSQFTQLREGTEKALEKVRETVEKRLEAIQQDNNAKLEKMRETVDEKLHKTLEDRLGKSFQLVSERLEQVHQGLGEMQSLANGVGDLKRVLSGVKTRGILGEIQLGNILEQILTREQYETNVSTKQKSREAVEFAIKLPGKDEEVQHIWLPIDSKFPLDKYQQLLDAYDAADHDAIERAGKSLESAIKSFAKDIQEKYIEPPFTTDFGIMFLPVEGLYAEVARRNGLLEDLQRNYRIIITGPTTLSAFLNSLQMGFKTLAIEKRSSEVWKILSAVKTEFGKFGGVLEKVQEKLTQASKTIDAAGVRSRAIERKLRKVEELPEQEKIILLEGKDA